MELQRITSRENRRLVHARKVRDGKDRSQVFIEGRRLVIEALRSEMTIRECFIAEGYENSEVLQSIFPGVTAIFELSDPLFRSLTATDEPQGVILLAERPRRVVSDLGRESSGLPVFLFLTEVNNPSNLGAVLRSAEAAGVGGVFVSKHSADVFSPKALRASMGAAFRIPITEDSDFADVLGGARSAGLNCLAVDGSGGTSYLEVDWTSPHLLVFGSEAHGLSKAELELIGKSISIPMENGVESLNLAVAAGVVLFEARRRFNAG